MQGPVLTLLLCMVAVGFAANVTFPDLFLASFNETVWVNPGQDNTTKQQNGVFYYSYTEAVKAQRVDRERSDLNSLCKRVVDAPEPCQQHSFEQGKRYIFFPQRSQCCSDACEGCGMLIPQWVAGATFDRTVTTRGYEGTVGQCDIYSKQGETSIDSYGQLSSPAALEGSACAIYDGGNPPTNTLMPYLFLFDPDSYSDFVPRVSLQLPSACQNAKPCPK